MKILHVIASMDPHHGGVCQAVRTTIKGLDATGEVLSEVASLDGPGAAYLAGDPFITHALGPAKGPWARSPKMFGWLVANLPRFDTVIIHGLWLYHGYAVRKALNFLRNHQPSTINHQLSTSFPRCYLMPHGMLDPYFQRDPSRRLKAIRNWFYWKLIEGKVVNEADGLLFTCEDEKLLARESFRPYQPKLESVVGLGVEEPPAYTAEMKAAFAAACPGLGDQPYLLFLSRIHPKKGVDLLIRAYADLASKVESQKSQVGDNSSATAHCSLITDRFPPLVIAGPLDSAYAREMQALAAELLPITLKTENLELVTPQIHFPGMLQGDAKWGAFHGCDAFVLPSHQENFGIAVVEALACGKPVLISNKVNIWREIHKVHGCLVANDDEADTLELLGRWSALPVEDRVSMSFAAKKAFRNDFSLEISSARTMQVFQLS